MADVLTGTDREEAIARLAEAGWKPTEDRDAIQGTTDSEHFFQLLLSRRARHPGRSTARILRDAVRDVRAMAEEADPDAEVALNVVWSVEDEMVGSRLGRSLWYLERDAPHRCEACGETHPDPDAIPDDAA